MAFSCQRNGNNSGSEHTPNRIGDYAKPTETFEVGVGQVIFDTLPQNLKTHTITAGEKYFFIYQRSGLTIIDANDWEAKFVETLIFQLDTSETTFEYCDSSLTNLSCKYYWVGKAKEIKKEIRNIDKGCIKGNFSGDSLKIQVDINSGFGFGGLLEKEEDRTIAVKKEWLLSGNKLLNE